MNKYNLIDILDRQITIDDAQRSNTYKFVGIEIPMIQRDYAQGRPNEAPVRKRFLDSIFYALENGNALELDFIYGAIKNIDQKVYFTPLDGQQRLTTLFLLYWYIGNRELDNAERTNLQNILSRFSYATRISAREFCEKISRLQIVLNKMPGSQIKDAAWFYDSYKKDPTVLAMLTMLDAIHLRYEKAGKELYDALAKLTFYILPLDGFNLSDELYIKMNARGKQLSNFENFKADLINWLQDGQNKRFEEFNTVTQMDGRLMPYHLAFGNKLDNSWANLFWEYTKVKADQKDKIIDPYFILFLHRYLLGEFIINDTISQEAIEKHPVFLKLYTEESFTYEGFDMYKQLLNEENAVKKLQLTLDQLTNSIQHIQEYIQPLVKSKAGFNLFDRKIGQRQRIILIGATLYMQKNTFDVIMFKRWMRLLWNIVSDPDIRSIPVMVSIIRLVEKLSVGSGDIYNYLQEDSVQVIIDNDNSFAKAQIEEERKKAALILSDSAWEAELIRAEKHPLFAGNIRFLLIGEPTITEFISRRIVAKKIFSIKGAKEQFGVNHLLMRAIISQQENWNELYEFNFGTNTMNWQLLLRRKSKIQNIICRWCDLGKSSKAYKNMSELVIGSSTIKAWAENNSALKRARHIHEQLYMEQSFHNWMQNSKAVNLKWSNDRIYIHRPRSWYDWVTLDNYRNQIASALSIKYQLKTSQKCGNSKFYWGAKLEFEVNYLLYTVSLEFDEIGHFKVGVRDDSNSISFAAKFPLNPIDTEPGWHFRKVYNYISVTSTEDINLLIKEIDNDIFDINNSTSLLHICGN